MAHDETATAAGRAPGTPIRTIRAEVVAGPDRGKTHVSDADSVDIGTAEGNGLRLTDPTVSRFHLSLQRAADRIAVVDHGSTNGTVIGPASFRDGKVEVKPGAQLQLGDTTIRVDDDREVVIDLHDSERLAGLVGRSAIMRRLMASVHRLADKNVTVHVRGESGTGKELVARVLHEASGRSGPMVVLDCGAIAPQLFASELFGHEKGAFTGAAQRHEGAFERANGGTLFLDEVGELPLEQQAALLGALERRRARRVGGTEDIEVDVRLVSATARDLRRAVNDGQVRLDLYYRLAVVTVETPPLRKRRDDIPLLVAHFLREQGYEGTDIVSNVFSDAQLQRLQRHDWPGNVRELRNVVSATLAMGETPASLQGDLPEHGDAIERVMSMPSYKQARRALLDEFEVRFLSQLLQQNDGNIRKAARAAGMDRNYLSDLLRRHGLR